ncbi:hypothetical protein KM043_005442 [Ampulex compressa]|nr:hypothetical protein KM043_005442 [Ampulex compressa]
MNSHRDSAILDGNSESIRPPDFASDAPLPRAGDRDIFRAALSSFGQIHFRGSAFQPKWPLIEALSSRKGRGVTALDEERAHEESAAALDGQRSRDITTYRHNRVPLSFVNGTGCGTVTITVPCTNSMEEGNDETRGYHENSIVASCREEEGLSIEV